MNIEISPPNAKAKITLSQKKTANATARSEGEDFDYSVTSGTVFGFVATASDGWMIGSVEVYWEYNYTEYDYDGNVVQTGGVNGSRFHPPIYSPSPQSTDPYGNFDISTFEGSRRDYTEKDHIYYLYEKRPTRIVVHCNYAPTYYTITTRVLPDSSAGSVSGGGSYLAGNTATLTATAKEGYSFSSWTSSLGDTSANPVHSIVVTRNETWTASFIKTNFFVFRIHTPTSLVPTFNTANLFSGSMYQFVKSTSVIKSDNSLYVATFDIDSAVSNAIVNIGFSHSGTTSVAMYFSRVSDNRITFAGITMPNNIHVELTAASAGTIVDVYLGYDPYLYVGPGITGQDYIDVVDHQGDYSRVVPWYNSRNSANGLITLQDVDIISRLSISVDQQNLDRFRRERKVPVIVTSDGVRKILDTNEIWIDFPFSNETDKTETAPRMVNKSAFIKGNPWIVIDALQEGLLFSSDSKMLLYAGDHALRCRTLGI